ncbi:MAG: hypothetical protein U5K79_15180 [Cyclobacteriaceae bacterium]|nr:hypothetical protein [Cyclobacteriaceae bacterium]
MSCSTFEIGKYPVIKRVFNPLSISLDSPKVRSMGNNVLTGTFIYSNDLNKYLLIGSYLKNFI